ncbi:MAG TPA: cytochrome P450 [Pyrinomonadaceae bacterium]|nr:cytochrome P450 [Pyrinomonadaceae bacterium]
MRGTQTRSEVLPTPAGLGALKLFRLMPRFQREPLRVFAELTERFGHVVRMKGLWTAYQITHPRDIEHVLQTNSQNYRKGRQYREFRASIGNGLLISDGEFWRRQRRLAQPAFHRQRINAFGEMMTGAAVEMLARWQTRAASKEPFNVVTEMMRLTLRIVGSTIFGTDLSAETDHIARSLDIARAHAIRRMWQPVKLPVTFPTRANRAFLRAIRESEQVIYRMIDARRRGEVATDDLLSLLMRARDEETGEAMSDEQLRAEAATILTAGHETTALALSWTWYLLSQHPEVEARLHAELDAVLEGGRRRPTVADLPNLNYTRMVVEEAMRLYPPVWVIGRTAIADDEIGGYRVEANSEVVMCQYVTHRHPEFWDDPEKFDPERFLPERVAARPRYAYFPFGGGPRQCIGNNFALMEAQLVLACVASRYRLRLAPGQHVEPEASITLHPRRGIRMTLESRHR